VPENICAEQQLQKNGWQCPEEDNSQIVPLVGGKKELKGEEEPERGKYKNGKVNQFGPWCERFQAGRGQAARQKPPPQAAQKRLNDEKGIFLNGNIAKGDSRYQGWVVSPDSAGDQIIIPGCRVGKSQQYMDGNDQRHF